ncbi:hypothetical protein IPM65_04080 [Candidatus Roizmanbacteria bacterium]|nr:MAG: hypothetical protein IPM65_04080 [Candidatus Roizmanbacteria bacterium]
MNKLHLAVVSLVLAAIVASVLAFAPVQAQSTVTCLDTDSLVQDLGTYSSRVKFDLFDDQHTDPAGWRVIYDGNNPISWVVPQDYVVQYGDPMQSLTGNGETEVMFFAASIWMPWQCRTGGATSTPMPSPSATPSPTAEPSETPIPQPGQYAPVKDWAEYLGWNYHGLVDPPMGYQVEVLEPSTLPNGYKAVGDGIVIERTDSNRTMPPGWYTVYGFMNEFLPLVVR